MQCPTRATAAEAAYDERECRPNRGRRDRCVTIFLLTRQTSWTVPEDNQVNALASATPPRSITFTYVDVSVRYFCSFVQYETGVTLAETNWSQVQ